MSDIAISTVKMADARGITVETQDFAIQAIIDQTHNPFTSDKTLAVNASRSKSRPSEQNKKMFGIFGIIKKALMKNTLNKIFP